MPRPSVPRCANDDLAESIRAGLMPRSVSSGLLVAPAYRGRPCSDDTALVEMGELRLDSVGGFVATLDEVLDYYSDKYSPDEITDYWRTQCLPLEEPEARRGGCASGETSKLAKALERSHFTASEERWGSAGNVPCSRSQAIWEYQHDNGVWELLLPKDSSVLESHYLEDPHAEFKARMGPSSLQYNIRLGQWKQCNMVSGKSRCLRRIYVDDALALDAHTGPDEADAGQSASSCKELALVPCSTSLAQAEDDELHQAIAASLVLQTSEETSCDGDFNGMDEALAVSLQEKQRTLKVTCGDDTRRTRLAWHANAGSEHVLSAIHAAVFDAFGEEVLNTIGLAQPALQYMDEDGDLCSLVEATLQDFLFLQQSDVLRVFLKPCALSGAVEEDAAADKPGAHLSNSPGQESAEDGPTLPPSANGTVDLTIGDEYDLDWSLVDVSSAADEL